LSCEQGGNANRETLERISALQVELNKPLDRQHIGLIASANLNDQVLCGDVTRERKANCCGQTKFQRDAVLLTADVMKIRIRIMLITPLSRPDVYCRSTTDSFCSGSHGKRSGGIPFSVSSSLSLSLFRYGTFRLASNNQASLCRCLKYGAEPKRLLGRQIKRRPRGRRAAARAEGEQFNLLATGIVSLLSSASGPRRFGVWRFLVVEPAGCTAQLLRENEQ
jgi:hypothetical protein